MTSVMAALWSVSVLLGVPLLAALTWRWFAARRLVYGACLGICLVVFAVALAYLVDAASAPSLLRLPLGLPWIGAHFRIDALAAFFLVVANLGGAAASLFAIGYGQHEKAPGRVLPFYPAFLAGMNLVVLADDAFTFLFAWEFMSLSSWALVMAHHRDPENSRRGLRLPHHGELRHARAAARLRPARRRATAATLSPRSARAARAGLPGVVLVLALIGAGSKAGLVPLHVWLPLAHPAAPSHVSALMSGVMTKVAVYGFIRIVFDLMGPPAWWWSMPVLAARRHHLPCSACCSALMQHDLKRLLAYHTVENIGIIFIGLGLALAFSANGMPAAAALALTAALFHVFNHTLFKSLLFFGAGAVLVRDRRARHGAAGRADPPHAAHRVRLPHRLHGDLGAAAAQRLRLRVADLPGDPAEPRSCRVGSEAASSPLSAPCSRCRRRWRPPASSRRFGVTFLGRARTPAAAQAQRSRRASLAAMFALAALCLFAGILPGSSSMDWRPVDASARRRPHAARRPALLGCRSCRLRQSRSSYNGLLVFAFIAVSTLARGGDHPSFCLARRAPGAGLGLRLSGPGSATQYTADSFAQPIRRVFGDSGIPRARDTSKCRRPATRGRPASTVTLRDPVWDAIYAPIVSGVGGSPPRSSISAVPDHPPIS